MFSFHRFCSTCFEFASKKIIGKWDKNTTINRINFPILPFFASVSVIFMGGVVTYWYLEVCDILPYSTTW